MKKLIGTVLAILFSVPCHATNIVATVNDVPISRWDLENVERLLKVQHADKYETEPQKVLEKDALNNIVDTLLKKQKAASLNITMPEQEINNAIAHLEMQNQMPAGALLKMLKQNNITEKTLRDQIEADLLWLSYLRTQAKHIDISPTSVSKKKQVIRDELTKQGIKGDSVLSWELAQGVLPENVNPNNALESKTCDAFLEHITIGSLPETAKRGWVDPHNLPSELYALLSDIAVGETLGPLKTPQGLLLFMKCDVKSQRVMPTQEEIKEQMEIEQMEMLSNRLLEIERRRAVIEYK